MSEFRLFCIVLFVSMGLLAAASNRVLFDVSLDALLIMPLCLAAGVVALFGKRKARP